MSILQCLPAYLGWAMGGLTKWKGEWGALATGGMNCAELNCGNANI